MTSSLGDPEIGRWFLDSPFVTLAGMSPTELLLPSACETALLERFLKAEAMALWAVRSAKSKDVPPGVLSFLLRHEEEEAKHLKEFETRLGVQSHVRAKLPRMPSQWWALVIHLFGYEALGLEFAKLLVQVQPELTSILADELVHVEFFEREVKKVLDGGGSAAAADRSGRSARAPTTRLASTQRPARGRCARWVRLRTPTATSSVSR